VARFAKRFSIAHPDSYCKGSMFYDAMKRADSTFVEELADVYFGTSFEYEYKGEKKVYSNSMGVGITPDSDEFYWLMKAQEDFGFEASLTINPTYHPWELMFDHDVIKQFVNYVGDFYAAGVRNCTISNVSLMRLNILQKEFPDMKWKNTVNHKVKTAQEYIDYVKLGYTNIQVDRSLNRNLDELKNIRKVADKFGTKVYMLVHEDCMPECPMFMEHTQTLSTRKPYSVKNACQRWSFQNTKIPRINLDAYWMYSKTFDLYEPLVDVFKYSGRFYHIDENSKFEWFFGDRSDFPPEDVDLDIRRPNFESIYNDGEGDYLSWFLPMASNPIASEQDRPIDEEIKPVEGLPTELNINQEFFKEVFDMIDKTAPPVEKVTEIPITVWDTKQGRALEKKLTNCKSQCYDCHLCEITFGVEHFDSVIDITEEFKEEQEPLVKIRVKEIVDSLPTEGVEGETENNT